MVVRLQVTKCIKLHTNAYSVYSTLDYGVLFCTVRLAVHSDNQPAKHNIILLQKSREIRAPWSLSKASLDVTSPRRCLSVLSSFTGSVMPRKKPTQESCICGSLTLLVMSTPLWSHRKPIKHLSIPHCGAQILAQHMSKKFTMVDVFTWTDWSELVDMVDNQRDPVANVCLDLRQLTRVLLLVSEDIHHWQLDNFFDY